MGIGGLGLHGGFRFDRLRPIAPSPGRADLRSTFAATTWPLDSTGWRNMSRHDIIHGVWKRGSQGFVRRAAGLSAEPMSGIAKRAASRAGTLPERRHSAEMNEMTQSIRAFTKVSAAFRLALRRFLAFSEAAAGAAGVTAQQYQALLVVKTHSTGAIMIREFADQMLLQHNGAVQMVDRLVAGGLVRAKPFADRRSQRARFAYRKRGGHAGAPGRAARQGIAEAGAFAGRIAPAAETNRPGA